MFWLTSFAHAKDSAASRHVDNQQHCDLLSTGRFIHPVFAYAGPYFMKSMNDFRFSGPASDKRRHWGDERHIRLMAKKRLRPVVIVGSAFGYALLLHEADARAQ
ncbi:hypothetical protein [Ottowia sp. oral taxon 894]|uniref:hypothetical protein n=1 Tax=Ottowia sp. oral taxon 894 TaxID=1658672 RepID=UPI0012E10799|nr:hypothetical protein [Ottowia sp. oral taxon 894]